MTLSPTSSSSLKSRQVLSERFLEAEGLVLAALLAGSKHLDQVASAALRPAAALLEVALLSLTSIDLSSKRACEALEAAGALGYRWELLLIQQRKESPLVEFKVPILLGSYWKQVILQLKDSCVG